jgi:hypothetical protein
VLPDVLGFAIVDEVDSILIDESRNPMIISQPRSDNGTLVATVDGVSTGFVSQRGLARLWAAGTGHSQIGDSGAVVLGMCAKPGM